MPPSNPNAQPLPPPYQHQSYPAMLYRREAGVLQNCTVRSEDELDAKLSEGWVEHPDDAPIVPGAKPVKDASMDELKKQLEAQVQENAALKAKLAALTPGSEEAPNVPANTSETAAPKAPKAPTAKGKK